MIFRWKLTQNAIANYEDHSSFFFLHQKQSDTREKRGEREPETHEDEYKQMHRKHHHHITAKYNSKKIT